MGMTRWTGWTFDTNFTLTRDETLDEQVPAKGNAPEWPLEVLFGLNLDVLLPHFGPRMVSMSNTSDDWGGPDLVAVDALGATHCFEMKNGASSSTALHQVLGYALSRLALLGGSPRGLEVSLDGTFAGIAESASKIGLGVTAEDLGKAHRGRLEAPFPMFAGTGTPHLHVVAPYIGDRPETAELARDLFRWGHVPIWLWDVRIQLSDVGGRLWLRDVTGQAHEAGDRNVGDEPWRIYEVVCEAAESEPRIGELGWQLAPHAPAWILAWLAPRLGLELRPEGEGASVTLRRHGDDTAQADGAVALGELLLRFGEPDGGTQGRVRACVRNPIEWTWMAGDIPVLVTRHGGKHTIASFSWLGGPTVSGPVLAEIYRRAAGYIQGSRKFLTKE